MAGVLLVHSFSEALAGWADYSAFARLFGVEAREGMVQRFYGASSLPLFGVWIVGDCSFLSA